MIVHTTLRSVGKHRAALELIVRAVLPLRAPARLVFVSMLVFHMKYLSCRVGVCGCGCGFVCLFVFFTVFKLESIATSHFLFRE